MISPGVLGAATLLKIAPEGSIEAVFRGNRPKTADELVSGIRVARRALARTGHDKLMRSGEGTG